MAIINDRTLYCLEDAALILSSPNPESVAAFGSDPCNVPAPCNPSPDPPAPPLLQRAGTGLRLLQCAGAVPRPLL